MKTSKKFLSLLLTLAMAFTLALPAMAEEGGPLPSPLTLSPRM